MGREASAEGRCGPESGPVKALLESHEIILRGAIRRRFELSRIEALSISGDTLRFRVGAEEIDLDLGAKEAAAWLRKISAPPPTLAEKLGIGPARKVLFFGEAPEPLLREALHDFQAKTPGEAVVALAVVTNEAVLAEAIAEHARAMPAQAPLWIVHPKGAKASLTDGQVRATMRGLGFIDSKSSAVSDAFTATRYALRSG